MDHELKIGLAQISPVWLDKMASIKKVEQTIIEAVNQKCVLVVFGEALIPGYPMKKCCL